MRSVYSLLSSQAPRSELDSHADTCCFGLHSYVLSETMRTVDVSPFLSDIGAVEAVPIVSCAVAYDDQKTQTTFILIFHQVLYWPPS